MSEIDWTAVIITVFGGGGSLVTLVIAVLHLKKPSVPRAVEEQAVERVSTPAAPGNDSNTVKGLVSLANEIGILSGKLDKQKTELDEVKAELGSFRKSYSALYWWGQRIITNWDELKEDPNPPNLPPDIHHP